MTTEAEQYARLELVTGRAADKWRDILTLPEPVRSETLAMWRDDDWVQNPDYFAQVVAIVGVLVQVAGAVAGVAGGVQGAAGAVSALRAT